MPVDQAIAETKVYKNPTLQKRFDQGLCLNCGKNKPMEGLATCEVCRSKDNSGNRERYRSLKSQGLCTQCGKKPAHNHTMCDECKIKYTSETTNKKRIRSGLCLSCGGENNSGFLRCDACRAKLREEAKEKYKIKKEHKVCRFCGLPSDGKGTTCKNCREKILKTNNERKKKLAEEGRCVVCSSKIENNGKHKNICKECRNKANASSKKSQQKNRQIVLEAYGNKCVCCGWDYQDDLAMDHIYNDGKEHRKHVFSSNFYRWLIRNNFPKDRFQILCNNCNIRKYRNGGVMVYPFRKEVENAN